MRSCMKKRCTGGPEGCAAGRGIPFQERYALPPRLLSDELLDLCRRSCSLEHHHYSIPQHPPELGKGGDSAQDLE